MRGLSGEVQNFKIGAEMAAESRTAMHADLKCAEQRLHSMADELKQFKLGHEICADANRDLQADVLGLQQKAQQLKDRLAFQHDEAEANTQLKADLGLAKRTTAAAEKELLNAKSQSEVISQSLAERDDTVTILQEQLAAQQSACQRAGAEQQQLAHDLAQADQTATDLKQELQIVHQNWMTLVKGLHEELGVEVTSAKKEALEIQQALQQAQQESLQAQQQADQALQKLVVEQGTASTRQNNLESARLEFADCQASLERQTEALHCAEQQLLASNAQVADLSQKLKDAQEADDKQQQAVQIAQHRADTLAGQLEHAKASQDQAEAKLVSVQAELASLRSAASSLQRDIDGYQRDNAALRASLGACQRQSEKFRTELMLAHRSQQGMLATLEAARQEGDGLRGHLAAQLQVLPNSMKGTANYEQKSLSA